MNILPRAFEVVHQWNGNTNSVVFKDRPRAEEYAVQWHGTVEELYRKSDFTQPVKKETT